MARKQRTAAQKRATARLVALNKRRRRGGRKSAKRRRRVTAAAAPKRRRRRTITAARGRTVARRRRRSTAVARPRRRRAASSRGAVRRRRSRSRGISTRGMIGQVKQGVKDAAFILGGEVAAKTIAGYIPLDKTGIMGTAVTLGSAIGAGMVARRFVGADAARMVVAGGIAAAVRTYVKGANIPVVSAALGDDIGAYLQELGAYESLPGYDAGMGDAEPSYDGAVGYGY